MSLAVERLTLLDRIDLRLLSGLLPICSCSSLISVDDLRFFKAGFKVDGGDDVGVIAGDTTGIATSSGLDEKVGAYTR